MERYEVNNIQFKLTHRCNLNCEWCTQHKTVNEPAPRSVEYYYEQACKIIDDVDHSPVYVFIGGEPLLELEMLKKLVARIRKKDTEAMISVVTNGLLLNKALIPWFEENKVIANISTTLKCSGTKNASIIFRKDILEYLDRGILTNVAIVVDPKEEFADKVITSLNLFRKPMIMPFDEALLHELGDNLPNIERNLRRISEYIKENFDGVRPGQLIGGNAYFLPTCKLPCLVLHPEGNLVTCDRALRDAAGEKLKCRVVHETVDPETYQAMQNLIDKYDFTPELVLGQRRNQLEREGAGA